MDTFKLREQLVDDYGQLIRSYITIADPTIAQRVEAHLANELLPKPLVQLNPRYRKGARVHSLVQHGLLHRDCAKVFATPAGDPFELYQHQVEAIEKARAGRSYVVTTGTGSGKSLTYIIPIVDHILREGTGKGVRAVIVYPMNALANSQRNELKKFLPDEAGGPVRFERYTGQESDEERQRIIDNPPDILLTNYVMLELLLTRPHERPLIAQASHLDFLVLDELHTYRGRQGADVALLTRRVKDATGRTAIRCIGTSATMADAPTWAAQQRTIAEVASAVFGQPIAPSDVIGETLERTTAPIDAGVPAIKTALSARITRPAPDQPDAFLEDPLARWLEGALGVEQSAEGRLERRIPRCIEGPDGAAAELAEVTGEPADACEAAIRATLLQGHRLTDHRGRSLLAFRLHQFLAKGETVYASPEPPGVRHISLRGQQFVPGEDRKRVLLPLAFCRECGHAYYTVRRERDARHRERVVPRGSAFHEDDEPAGEPGFLTFE
ncbi:MAG: DEAD/DEAH box helicase, partial [Myxococcales bacterium]|nr:DEAD/DEAH box helicase [Myxococcales bacterium]